MQQSEIYEQLNEIFRDNFDDPKIQLTANTTAHDIKGWDSVNHVNLIVAIEEEFHIKLKTSELESLKDVGEMVRLIQAKTGG